MLGIRQDRLAAFEAVCRRERAPYAVVGEATGQAHLLVSDSEFDNAPVDLPLSVLFENLIDPLRRNGLLQGQFGHHAGRCFFLESS